MRALLWANSEFLPLFLKGGLYSNKKTIRHPGITELASQSGY